MPWPGSTSSARRTDSVPPSGQANFITRPFDNSREVGIIGAIGSGKSCFVGPMIKNTKKSARFSRIDEVGSRFNTAESQGKKRQGNYNYPNSSAHTMHGMVLLPY